jgi:hypothetical protein
VQSSFVSISVLLTPAGFQLPFRVSRLGINAVVLGVPEAPYVEVAMDLLDRWVEELYMSSRLYK